MKTNDGYKMKSPAEIVKWWKSIENIKYGYKLLKLTPDPVLRYHGHED